ncbi:MULTISPECIES: MFS transporter [unclassified Leptolyngbya]|uniref:MFS transporter n=1 Tax=unclassified Leptolyngbya TaxID=2650499 RepID=UPI0016869583|nr:MULTISPECIES: MFS transporter [unclassified Leptolyngbya]MBD1910390.1 MFS transporter [Leptolyngbya sp. FACHB-8]MBD2157786.1 MFS transporter [Leptolyngbya sp. FACHB-16]
MNPAATPTVKPPSRSFSQQLDASEMTRTMWLLWGLSAGLIALDGFDFFIIGVALPFVGQDFHLSPTQTGAVAVAALLGSLVGSLTLGPITDKVGRQRMLMVDVALFVLATAGTVFAWNALSLIGFRFLVGVAIGADYPISVAYVSENVPSRLRGRMVIGAFTFQAIGALLGALTGWGIIYLFQMLYPDSVQPAIHYAWRWMLGIGLGLAIAIALLRFRCLLESPSYHILRGEYQEASQAASALLNTPINLTPETDPPPQTSHVPYSALFSPLYRRQTLLASIPWFLQDIATYGVGIFTPTILGALAFARVDSFMAREAASAKGAALVDICLIAGFLLAILLVERVGRIQLQIMGFLGMAAGLTILAASDMLAVGPKVAIALVFIGFFVFNLMMNAGPNATTFLLSGEVFPTAIRASGAGFAAAVAKAGAVLGTFELPILKTTLGIAPLMLLLSLCCVLAAVATYQFRIKTQPSVS